MRRIIFLLLIFGSQVFTMAQVNITQPYERMVFQRNNSNQAPLLIAGSYQIPVDSIMAQAEPRQSGQGILVNWTKICNVPQNGYFTGSITGTGGWYKLKINAYKNGLIVGSDSVNRVGIGEVFAIAGQSNAQGGIIFGIPATDDRVNSIGYDNDSTIYNKLPFGFSQLIGDSASIGPFHFVPWAWGKLGDQLASNLNVPILFYGAAHGGTYSKDWSDAALGIAQPDTGRTWLRTHMGAPYTALEYCVAYYASLTGLRAVLWQQGEADWANTTQNYFENVSNVINKTREHSEHPSLAWMVARSTYNGSHRSQIYSAQQQLATLSNVFQGPDLDLFFTSEYRTDYVHFNTPLGQLAYANEWFLTITNSGMNFLGNSVPMMASPFILPNLVCNVSNPTNPISLNMPTSYSKYAWSNRQNTNSEAKGYSTTNVQFINYPPAGYEKFNWRFDSTATITVPQGRYALNVKKASKKTLFSPIIELNPFTLPTTPNISANYSQIRPGENLSLTGSNCNGIYVWSNGSQANPNNFAPSATASYTAQCKTLYCLSPNSNSVSVTVSSCFPNALNLSSGVSSIESPYKSKLNVISTQNVNATGRINYSAKNNILLQPGFVADNGSIFTAIIEDCN